MKPSQKNRETKADVKEEKNQWWLEASIIAAVATALLFFSGVAYIQSYYSTFGIRFETLEIPSYWIMSNCFHSIVFILLYLAVFLFSVNMPPLILGPKDRFLQKGFHWIVYRNFGFIPLVVFIFGYYLLLKYSGDQGKAYAVKLIENPAAFQCTFRAGGILYSDYFYLYNNANYFYFFRPKIDARPDILIVPGSDLGDLRLGVAQLTNKQAP